MRNRAIKYILPPLICISILSAVWLSSPMYKRMKTYDVHAVDVTVQTIQNSIMCKGTIEALNEKAVHTSASVMIEDIDVEIGDFIKAGDVLFTAKSYDGMIGSSLTEVIGDTIADGGIISVFNQLFDDAAVPLPDIATAKVEVTQDQAVNILSPINGVITELNIQPSSAISSSTACVVVTDMDDLSVRCNVAEEFVQDISEGMECIITSDSFRDTVCGGTIEKIMPFASHVQNLTGSGSTVVEILVSIDKGDISQIKPGYSAKVKILNDTIKNAVTVPYEALQQDENNREFVYTISEDTAKKTYVQTGYELDDCVEVVSGLDGSETVAVGSFDLMGDGFKVRAVNEQ